MTWYEMRFYLDFLKQKELIVVERDLRDSPALKN